MSRADKADFGRLPRNGGVNFHIFIFSAPGFTGFQLELVEKFTNFTCKKLFFLFHLIGFATVEEDVNINLLARFRIVSCSSKEASSKKKRKKLRAMMSVAKETAVTHRQNLETEESFERRKASPK